MGKARLRFFGLMLALVYILFPGEVMSRSYPPVYPSKQKYAGQDITVYKYPYFPLSNGTEGFMKVYRKDVLLYTINKFFRSPVITSDDGRFLFVIHGRFEPELFSRFEKPCIEIYKDGKFFKELKGNQVIDTAQFILRSGLGAYGVWLYNYSQLAYNRAKEDCKECKQKYGELWVQRECKSSCDFAHRESKLTDGAVFVKDNHLYVLTSYDRIIKIRIPDMTVSDTPLSAIIPDKGKYDPPKFEKENLDIVLPDDFSLPGLASGKALDVAIAELVDLSIVDELDGLYTITVVCLVDTMGKASGLSIEVYSKRDKSFDTSPEMVRKIERWMEKQLFDKRAVPEGYDKYGYYKHFDLK